MVRCMSHSKSPKRLFQDGKTILRDDAFVANSDTPRRYARLRALISEQVADGSIQLAYFSDNGREGIRITRTEGSEAFCDARNQAFGQLLNVVFAGMQPVVTAHNSKCVTDIEVTQPKLIALIAEAAPAAALRPLPPSTTVSAETIRQQFDNDLIRTTCKAIRYHRDKILMHEDNGVLHITSTEYVIDLLRRMTAYYARSKTAVGTPDVTGSTQPAWTQLLKLQTLEIHDPNVISVMRQEGIEIESRSANRR